MAASFGKRLPSCFDRVTGSLLIILHDYKFGASRGHFFPPQTFLDKRPLKKHEGER